MSLTMNDMAPIQRAAAIMVALGPEISSKVLKNFSDSEVEAITLQIANLTDIPAEVEEEIVKYVSEIFLAKKFVNKGGVDYARKLLEQSFGSNKASAILKRLEGVITSKGFDLMKDIDAKQLQGFIQNELPQTIALILSQLNPTQAAQILTEFQPELQAEVSYRIATMEKISPEVFKEIEGVLESHFEPTGAVDVSVSGGTKTIADILNLVETSSEKGIMESIEAENPELASEIKNLMFVFEDIVLLDNRSVQR
ncbi:MAG: flagellar motor switch protein FliG, partial [candidate division Zixibacteria bacterium]|nr:flagellar motor switch protein FliG [candidate division Zixibacteria bacterium]